MKEQDTNPKKPALILEEKMTSPHNKHGNEEQPPQDQPFTMPQIGVTVGNDGGGIEEEIIFFNASDSEFDNDDDDDVDDEDNTNQNADPPSQENDTASKECMVLQDEIIMEVNSATASAVADDKETDETICSHRHRHCHCLLYFLCFLLGIGIIVGITFGIIARYHNHDDDNDDNGFCTFCHGAAEIESSGLDSIIAFEGISCGDIYKKMLNLMPLDDECTLRQADTAWKCGCPTFPPIPASSTCIKKCQQGESLVPKVSSDSANSCIIEDKWLSVVGNGKSDNVCNSLRSQTQSCECKPVINNDCISVLDMIEQSESTVQDDSINRTYFLCPNTDFDVGIFSSEFDLESGINTFIQNGQIPIVTKSNVEVLCGYNGSSSNNCTINAGTFGFMSTSGWIFRNVMATNNVLLQGITFRNFKFNGPTHSQPAAISLFTTTNLTVIDCIFEESGSDIIQVAPYTLGFPKNDNDNQHQLRNNNVRHRKLQNESTSYPTVASLRFIDCLFRNNVVTGFFHVNSLSLFNFDRNPLFDSIQVHLEINNCIFENCNLWSLVYWQSHGSLRFTNNCIIDNVYNKWIPPTTEGNLDTSLSGENYFSDFELDIFTNNNYITGGETSFFPKNENMDYNFDSSEKNLPCLHIHIPYNNGCHLLQSDASTCMAPKWDKSS